MNGGTPCQPTAASPPPPTAWARRRKAPDASSSRLGQWFFSEDTYTPSISTPFQRLSRSSLASLGTSLPAHQKEKESSGFLNFERCPALIGIGCSEPGRLLVAFHSVVWSWDLGILAIDSVVAESMLQSVSFAFLPSCCLPIQSRIMRQTTNPLD